jgi:hypothetical protein
VYINGEGSCLGLDLGTKLIRLGGGEDSVGNAERVSNPDGPRSYHGSSLFQGLKVFISSVNHGKGTRNLLLLVRGRSEGRNNKRVRYPQRILGIIHGVFPVFHES